MSKSIQKFLLLAFLFYVSYCQASNTTNSTNSTNTTADATDTTTDATNTTTNAESDDKMFVSFLNFVKVFNITYPNETEMHYRLGIYITNLKKNDLDGDNNLNTNLNEENFAKGITEFADLTDKEFHAFLLTPQKTTKLTNSTELFDPATDLPAAPVVQAEAGFLSN